MNSIIASSINGTNQNKVPTNQQVANGSHTSLLNSTIEFSVSGNKEHSSSSFYPGKYLVNLNSTEIVFNGQKKQKNGLDHTKNTFNNTYYIANGAIETKEKPVEEGIPLPKVQLYTGRIHVEWKQAHKIGAGLNNLGNTCFMNTVLQCLTYCPPLANYLLHDNDHSAKCSIQGFCMTCLLQKHMKRSIGKTGEVVKPVDIYQRLKLIAKHFQFGRQEDAHEYLRYVIDNLWKSCLSQSNNSKLDPASKETTVINQIFGGYHRSQVTCLRCKEKSNTFDHFMDFILDIKQNVISLEKALEKFTHPELLEEENSYKCPKCKMKVSAQKKFTVYKAPNVATFQLKRFDYNRVFGGKITKPISYPEKLNLRPYMSESKGEPVWYRLNAVLVHSGPSCNSGHYYCYVKNSNGFWYIMDDQRVHQVSLTQVLNQSAYVLFYIKTESTEVQTFKKCLDNRNLQMKGNNSATNYKKNPDNSLLKSSPLTERHQVKQQSPMLKHQTVSSTNINGKAPVTLSAKRDKVSFGIRTSMPNINDLCKLPIVMSPKKAKNSAIQKAGNNHSALVPYTRDSSESSDENENKSVHNKLDNMGKENNTIHKKSDCIVNENKTCHESDNVANKTLHYQKKYKLGLPNGVPKLQVRRKLSKSVLNISRSSISSHDSNGSGSKVVATSSWTVTDVPMSPSAGSSCSNTSVNSTTDWHVTNIKSEKCHEKSPSLTHNEAIRTDVTSECVKMPFSDEIPSKPGSSNLSFSKSEDNSDSCVSFSELQSNKNSDFREFKSEKPFLESEKSNSNQQSYSFLKRKTSHTGKEVPKNSQSQHREKRHDFLPKKFKSSEEPSESNDRLKNCDSDAKTDADVHKLSSSSKESHWSKKSKHSNSSSSNNDKDGFTKYHSESLKQNSIHKRRSSGSSSGSDSEYEWLEKTKDNAHNFVSPKKENRTHYHSTSSSSYYKDRKNDVISELSNNSRHFYGSAVSTWNGESRYGDTSQSNGEKRKYLEQYEDEYDRGKIRKTKPKDHFHSYGNSFQKYSERYYNNVKFHKHNSYGHFNKYKPYDSHYNWKRNHQDYHRSRKDFRSHYRH